MMCGKRQLYKDTANVCSPYKDLSLQIFYILVYLTFELQPQIPTVVKCSKRKKTRLLSKLYIAGM